MFCSNCGKELPDESEFCGYCGSNLKGKTKNKGDNQDKVITKKDNSEIIALIVIGIILLSIVVFVFVKYWKVISTILSIIL